MSPANRRIGIIEDNRLVRESLETVLELKDFQGVGFCSAEEFLNADRTQVSFAALIVDYRLPGRDGLQLIAQLREQDDETGMILMSGNFDADIQESADRLGGVRTLRKPCHPQVLLEALSEIIA